MKNIAKKLANLVLGFALVLGVGISVGSSVNKEAIGVRATDVTTVTLNFKTNGKTSGDGSELNTTTTLSDVFEDATAISSISNISKAYYAGYAGLKLGAGSTSGIIQFNLENTLTTATKVVVNAKLYNISKAATLKIDECSDSAKSLTSSFADYEFTFTSKSVSSIKLTGSMYCWIRSITLYEESKAPTVTGVTLAPSETTTLVVGKAKEFTVGIDGDNLTGNEVISASYTEYELEEDGVSIDKTDNIQNGEVITATAILAGANGLLRVKYNDSIEASVEF